MSVTATTINDGIEITHRKTKSGKPPHQLIKEFIASKLNTNEFDICFDLALKLGLQGGTEVYDKSIESILVDLEIPDTEILEMLSNEYID